MIALLCLVSLPSLAKADAKDEEARMHFRVATAYYDSGRFADAAREFKLAHDLSQRPQLLYNLFLASRDAGDIDTAAASLRQYLAEVPDVKDREVLEARLAALEKILATRNAREEERQRERELPVEEQEPETPASEEEQEPEPVVQTVPAQPTAAEQPERLRWLPWTLMGTGIALVASGATVGYFGMQDEQALKDEDACGMRPGCVPLTKAEYQDLKSEGKFKVVLADALWIPGAVTAAVGLTFLFWKPWENSEDGGATTPTVDIACSSKSCGALVTGRF
jgi:tetratricopeptide (TPR) repeat protein